MAEDAVAYVSIVPVAKGVGKQIESQIDGQSVGNNVGTAVSKGFLARVGSAGAAAAQAISTSLVAATAAVGGVAIGKGLSRLLNIEDAQAKLTGLGNSAEAVTTIMNNALASVKGTAFGLDAAATVAAAAVAAGIKPGLQLQNVLKTIADTATIAGASMQDTGAIFNSVAARGKLQGDDLMQLQSRGVPVLAFLAKHYGITAKAASDMVSAGEVDFANFAAAMQENLGGAALKSGETTRGSFQNLLASLSRVGAGLLGGVFPLFQKTFAGITAALAPVEAKAATVGAAIGTYIVPIFEKLSGLLPTVGAAFAQFGTIIGPLVGVVAALGAGGLGPLVSKFLPGLGGALASLGGPIGIIVAAFAGLVAASPTLQAAFGSVLSTLGGALAQAASTLGPAISGLLPAIMSLVNVLAGALANALTTIVPFIVQFVGILSGVLAQVLPTVSALLIEVAGVIGDVLAAVMPLVSALLGALMPIFKALVPVITSLLAAIMPVISALIDAFVPIINAVVPIIVLLVNAIAPLIAALVQVLAPVLTFVANIIATVLTVAINILVAIIQGLAAVITWLVNNVAIPYFKALGVIFTWLWQNVVQPVAGFIGAALGVVGAVVSALWSTYVQPALNAIGAAFNWIWANVIKPVADFIGTAVRGIGSVIGSVFGTIGNIIKGAFNGVVSVVRGIFNTIIGLVNGVIDGINGVAGAVGSVIGVKIHVGRLPQLASGAVVNATPGGTDVTVGEGRWPEAVVPLSPKNMGLFGSGEAQPVYVQNPFTGEYLLAKVDDRASAVVTRSATVDARRFKMG